MIRAAGAVVWRGSGHAALVALIFRPKYRDWTFPKGKLDPGETPLAAAIREVAEETGQEVRPGSSLGETRYEQERGGVTHQKVVEWWAMEALGGQFRPGEEVAAMEWLPVDEARQRLTYDHDRELLDRFSALLPREN